MTSYITFGYKGVKPYVSLEMCLLNGQRIERKKIVEKIEEIKRSKKGKISGIYYPNFLTNFVIPIYYLSH